MLSRNLYLVVFSFTFHSYLILSLLGVQTKAATKSKGVRCTLLKDMFVTPTPRQSENDETDFEERKWMPSTPTLDSLLSSIQFLTCYLRRIQLTIKQNATRAATIAIWMRN